MKKLLMYSVIAGAIGMAACGTKSTNNGAVGRKSAANPNGVSSIVTSSQNNTTGTWGDVVSYTQTNVVNFLSMGMAQGDIGNVVGCVTAAREPCAIKFNISVNPPSNMSAIPLAQSGTQYQASSSGLLTIAVYDSFTGNGNSAIAAPIPLQSATMNYNGQSGTATLVFSNNLTTVTLSNGSGGGAQVNGQNFSGVITYQNNGNANNGPAMSGVLGNFQTSICYVFSCQ